MIRYNKYQRYFFAPDAASVSGGASASANQGGARETEGVTGADIDPFAGIELDDLDPEAKKVLLAGKEKFASLQKQLKEEAADRAKQQQQAREFQSKHDQLLAKMNQLTGANPQQNANSAKEQSIKKFTDILVSRNVPAENAKVQAEIMYEMMSDYGSVLKGEIGRDLAPFAGSIVQQQAESSWHAAVQIDKIGALQIKEVAEQAWSQVQLLVQQGQQVTPEVVNNLAGMAYFQHLQKGGAPVAAIESQQNVSPVPNFPNFGRSAGPGNAASRPPIVDPRAPKTTLDEATDKALQSVMSKWDIKPKAFRNGKA